MDWYRRYPTVQVYSFKYDGSVHRVWNYAAIPVQPVRPVLGPAWQQLPLAAGSILYMPSSRLVTEATGRRWRSLYDSLAFFFPAHWFNVVVLFQQGELHEYYCNLSSPARLQMDQRLVSYIDLELDVLWTPGERVASVDQAEFAINRVRWRYPTQLVQTVETTRRELHQFVSSCEQQGHPPYQLDSSLPVRQLQLVFNAQRMQRLYDAITSLPELV